MQLAEGHYSVIIIGAGPSGLMMAAQLLRYGVNPLIIDSKSGPTEQSKALAVQARTLEIYRQLGIIDIVLEKGQKAKSLRLHDHGVERVQLILEDLGKNQSLYPFLEILEQSKNEKLLLDYLTTNCLQVYWETELENSRQDGEKAYVQVKSKEKTINLTTDWLIGADGSHSQVRKCLGIAFKGDTYPQQFYLADLQLERDLGNDSINLFLGGDSFLACFGMKTDKTYRFIGNIPEILSQKTDLDFEDIKPSFIQSLNNAVSISKTNWFATYRLHHRMADQFRNQRCFLIGDAAHIHSPVGGQGMNTGLQDAYNLAWKLAGVIQQKIKPSILESYAEERMPVARKLLKTTDRIFNLVVSKNRFLRWLRPIIFKQVVPRVWKSEAFKKQFFKIISQIGINYRHSSISLHLSQTSAVKAGDRLPFLRIWDEKKELETDLHAWCSRPGFIFLILGAVPEKELFGLAQWISRNFPELQLFYLPPSGKNMPVFEHFEILPGQQKTLVIRPDMHIGMMSDRIDLSLLANYLENVVGCIRSAVNRG